MVNTHTHLFQTLLKGPGDDMVLKNWFTCMTGPAAVELTPADVYAAAMHGCAESIRSGVTTLVEFMYAHPRPGLTRPVIDAYEATGMRGFVCRGFFSGGAELVFRRPDRNPRRGHRGCTGVGQRAEPTRRSCTSRTCAVHDLGAR